MAGICGSRIARSRRAQNHLDRRKSPPVPGRPAAARLSASPPWRHPSRGVPGIQQQPPLLSPGGYPLACGYDLQRPQYQRQTQREASYYLSSGKAAGRHTPQPLQRTSSPKLSDVGSDREADRSQDLGKLLGSLGALDPFQVSTPQKVGSLPYVPRLDNLDQALQPAEDLSLIHI